MSILPLADILLPFIMGWVDVFICKLRKKISDLTGGSSCIETVWGRGYVLRDFNEDSNYFSRMLKKLTNMPPNVYRQRWFEISKGSTPSDI